MLLNEIPGISLNIVDNRQRCGKIVHAFHGQTYIDAALHNVQSCVAAVKNCLLLLWIVDDPVKNHFRPGISCRFTQFLPFFAVSNNVQLYRQIKFSNDLTDTGEYQ